MSRVVNNKPARVGHDTRQRILDIARQSRYRPNRQAVALATGKPPSTLALVADGRSHTFRSFFFSEVSSGILSVAAAHGMDLNLLMPPERPGSAYLDLVAGRDVAGLVVMSTGRDAESVRACADAGIPVVVIGGCAAADGVDTVACDNEGGAARAVIHLLQMGHVRIGFVAGPSHALDARERLAGYRRALREAGVAVDRRLVVEGDFLEAGGRDAMRQLLAGSGRPTAVLASNDASALGVISYLHETGLRVPADVAVVGFDDFPPASSSDPPLTTVHQPAYEMGQRAGDLLISRLAGRTGAERALLSTHLVVRGSCGASARPSGE